MSSYTLFNETFTHKIPICTENIVRLTQENCSEVTKLVANDCNVRELFGEIDVSEILSKSYETFGVYNIQSELVGVISLNDYPNIPSVPSWEWNDWLENLYGLNNIYPISTLWVHLIAFEQSYNNITKVLIRVVFERCYFLKHIILVSPPGVKYLKSFDPCKRVGPIGYKISKSIQTLYILERKNYVNLYKIRLAVEEDNDDILKIIDRYSDRLRELYGDYYIGELIKHDKNSRQIIVAEYNSYVVGVLILNENINYNLLNKHFELIPFNGLKKPHKDDKLISNIIDRLSSSMISGENDILKSDDLELFYNATNNTNQSTESLKSEGNKIEKTDSSESIEDFSFLNLSPSLFYNYNYNQNEYFHELKKVSTKHIIPLINKKIYSTILLDLDSLTDVHISIEDILTIDQLTNHKSLTSLNDDEDNGDGDDNNNNNVIQFNGESNCFILELIGCDLGHELSLTILYKAAFECFNNKYDYCLVTIPSDMKTNYLIQYFSKVLTKIQSIFSHELYLLHQNVISGRIIVRLANYNDLDEINNLIITLINWKIINEQLLSAFYDYETIYTVYVMLSEKQIIGIAIISDYIEQSYLHKYYCLRYWFDLTKHKPGSFGLIETLILSPIFQRHGLFFLRELHRLSDYSVLYYCLKSNDLIIEKRKRPLFSLLYMMAPVAPKISPIYHKPSLEEYEMPYEVPKQETFGLYLSTTQQLSAPRIEINNRIVIIGGGNTTVSFLESLLLKQKPDYLIIYTNITVISPHGLFYDCKPNLIRDMLFINSGYFHKHYINLLNIRCYINVIMNVVNGIDRKNKFVIIDNQCILPYDILILSCGEQFQKPTIINIFNKRLPNNLFIINTQLDAENSLLQLKDILNSSSNNNNNNNNTNNKSNNTVIVYGYYLDALCCLATLLEFGLNGKQIIYLYPPLENEEITIFNNNDLDENMLNLIRSTNIIIHENYQFINWLWDNNQINIKSVQFESINKLIEIDCIAMFMYHKKAISSKTFQAIHNSGLVYDGRLVIDKENRTNDPNIFAVGTLTKYSNKYHSDHLMHKYFNSEEVGYKLGQQIKQLLLPNDIKTSKIHKTKTINFNYKKPVIQQCKLPGGLSYLFLRKAGKLIPLEYEMIKGHYGRVIITGNCNNLDSQGYFRLHVNCYGTIETITCLSKFDIDTDNIIKIWGKHESVLNNLLDRYDIYGINDFYEYFRQPWAYAIYDTGFDKFMYHIERLISSIKYDAVSLIDSNENKSINDDQGTTTGFEQDEEDIRLLKQEICDMLNENLCRQLITTKLMDFLKDRNLNLPMYAQTVYVNMFLQQLSDYDPLFLQKNII